MCKCLEFSDASSSAIGNAWLALLNGEHAKACPDTLQVKCYQKHIWKDNPFLPLLIKPFSQRPAQGTVKRSSTLPGWRATVARVGNAWAGGAPGRGCQATVIHAGCRVQQNAFFQRELEPQSTPSFFQQHTQAELLWLSPGLKLHSFRAQIQKMPRTLLANQQHHHGVSQPAGKHMASAESGYQETLVPVCLAGL